MLTALVAAALFTFLPSAAFGANPSANLDQCANGPAPSPSSDGCDNTPNTDWVNGNLGASKAVYFEGESIPYRLTFDNLSTSGSHAVTIEWDTTKGGTHALDYIDSYNQSVLDANPCLGITMVPACDPLAPSSTFAIPADPQVTGALVTPVPGNLTLFGGTITGVVRPTSIGSTTCTNANSAGVYCYSTGSGFSGDKSAAITVQFTASVANPVLAWGGHIAARKDWGLTNSAVSIPGSPYHTRLIDLDGAGGNQDRSLSAEAVIFPGFIHIVKNTTGGDATFGYTASPSPLSNFNITTVNGTGEKDFDNITNFQSYTVTENTPPLHWVFDSLNCTVQSANGGTQTVNNMTATIGLKEGEEVTCTYANHHAVNSPALGTTPSENAGAIGDTLTDDAGLTKATSDAGGTISFYLFKPGDNCSDLTTAVYSSTGVAVSGNNTYHSADGTTKTGSNVTTQAGTYHWLAKYTGDNNNSPASSSCSDEPVAIGPNSPALGTTPSENAGAIGDTLTDDAGLTKATSDAGGTISFYLFKPGDNCSDLTTAVYSSTGVAVSGNNTYHSADGTTKTGSNVTTQAGTYHWLAKYTGDNNNSPASSSCSDEPVAIGPNSPALGTTPSENAGAIGDTLTDDAGLTKATSDAGGTISFYLFKPGDNCSDLTTAVYSSTGVAVSGNNTYHSADGATKTGSNVTTQAGTYHWLAKYTGDNNNSPASSSCSDEPVAIGPNSPALGTTPSENAGAIGDTLTDDAGLTKATSDAGGTISFYLFKPGDNCSDLTTAVYSSTGVAVSGNNTYHSADGATKTGSNVTTQAGTYHWLAKYTGDNNNSPASSSCSDEPVAIGPNSPALGTTPSENAGAIGDTLTDDAGLTKATSDAGGTISFYLFKPGDNCSDLTTAVYSSTGVAVSGNNTYHSADGATKTGSNVTTQAGTYHWLAKYTGDNNNSPASSSCSDEPVAIGPNSPALGTTPSENAGAIGDTLTDDAGLTKATSDAGGTISFYLFKPGDNCSDLTTAVYSSTGVAVSGNNTYHSADGATKTGSNVTTQAGTYHWLAKYTGDNNNSPASSSCSDEPVAIGPNSPALGTTPSENAGAIGDTLTDDAGLTKATSDAGGTISFYLFKPGDNCSDLTTAVYSSTGVAVSGNNTYHSADGATKTGSNVTTQAGTYHWLAKYTGDNNNSPASSSCSDEPVAIGPNSPALGTTPSENAGAIGDTLTDDAGLTKATSDAGGTISFYLFKPGDNCSDLTTAVYSSTGVAVSGNNTYHSADGTTKTGSNVTTQAGTYHWLAKYTGDNNNSPASSSCSDEPVVIAPNDTSLTTDAGGPYRLSGGELPSVDLHDTATLSGGTSDATGTITFTLFGPDPTPGTNPEDDCSGVPVGTATAKVDQGGDGVDYVSSPDITVTEPGTYHWVASYDGDSNNNGSESACGADGENPVVIAPHISVVKNPKEQVIRNGDTASWTIQVINDGSSTLTDVNVTDEQAPGCARTADQIAADRGSSTFAPNDTYSYDCSLANVTASFTNVAVATGTPEVGEDVSSQDTAHVTVINPAISISKTPHSQTVAFAGTVTFTIDVKNTGDSTLTNVRVTDAQAPGCARTSADIAQLASMAPGDELSYSCTVANVMANFTNVAVATGTPVVGPDVSANDSAAVTVGPPPPPVTHPAISIVKDPKSQTVTVGKTATFKITVTNTGDVALTNVTVTDALSPNCNRTIGTLAPGASTSYTCTRPDVRSSFNNVAVVTGTAGSTTVTAQDTAPVTAKKAFVPPKVVPKVVSHKKPKATG